MSVSGLQPPAGCHYWHSGSIFVGNRSLGSELSLAQRECWFPPDTLLFWMHFPGCQHPVHGTLAWVAEVGSLLLDCWRVSNHPAQSKWLWCTAKADRAVVRPPTRRNWPCRPGRPRQRAECFLPHREAEWLPFSCHYTPSILLACANTHVSSDRLQAASPTWVCGSNPQWVGWYIQCSYVETDPAKSGVVITQDPVHCKK